MEGVYIGLFITWIDWAAYNRHHSADSKLKNYKINSGFVNPEEPKSWAKQSDIVIKVFHFKAHIKLSNS